MFSCLTALQLTTITSFPNRYKIVMAVSKKVFWCKLVFVSITSGVMAKFMWDCDNEIAPTCRPTSSYSFLTSQGGIARGAGGLELPQFPLQSAPWNPPNKMTLCTGVYGELPF